MVISGWHVFLVWMCPSSQD